jgi:hypothetical protein
MLERFLTIGDTGRAARALHKLMQHQRWKFTWRIVAAML